MFCELKASVIQMSVLVHSVAFFHSQRDIYSLHHLIYRFKMKILKYSLNLNLKFMFISKSSG